MGVYRQVSDNRLSMYTWDVDIDYCSYYFFIYLNLKVGPSYDTGGIVVDRSLAVGQLIKDRHTSASCLT